MNKNTILVVEDDKAIKKLIVTAIGLQGYKCLVASNGHDALLEITSHNPDVVLLDLGLPDMSGIDLIQEVREWSQVPILVISARHTDVDKIAALDSGADDYLTKPFSIDELSARIRAILRRYNLADSQINSTIFVNGALKIDYAAGCVWVNEQEVHLTPIEFKIIVVLSKNVGKVVTHNYILKEVWGYENYDFAALRVFVATLRKKIESLMSQKLIQTHIGVGYRMIQHSEDR